MNLTEISFPVYPLKSGSPPQKEGDLTFYLTKDDEDNLTVHVVDDLSVEGTTLGRRRLVLKGQKVKLHKFKYALYFLSDLLKLSGPNEWFIDNFGKVFRYIKTKFVPLVYKQILAVHRIPSATLIEVRGLCGKHMVLYPPNSEEKYAAFLRISKHSYIFYGYADKEYPQSKKKI